MYFSYGQIHRRIHELEETLANAMNHVESVDEKQALEHAHDILVHQVAEYVRTAESKSSKKA